MVGVYNEWLNALQDTLRYGRKVAPRGMPVLERLAPQVRFDGASSLIYHPLRDLNYRFAVAEWLWMLAGSDLVEPLARFNSQMRKFSDDGVHLAGAYGPRIVEQLRYVVETLRRDPDSRQAVIEIWRPAPGPSKDIPCTLSVAFYLRGGKLESVWTMRSNDLWLGLPYDAYTFSRIASAIAGELGAEVGELVVTAGSSHLYEQHWAAAEAVVNAWRDGRSIDSPHLPGRPPSRLLDQVLRDPQQAYLYDDGVSPWEEYSRVLLAPGKAEALEVLIGMEPVLPLSLTVPARRLL